MLSLSKRLQFRSLFKESKLSKLNHRLGARQYSSLKNVFFREDETPNPIKFEEKTKEVKLPLEQVFEAAGIEMNFSDEIELGSIQSIEDLKEIVNDNNLWLSLNLSPVKKAKIKNTLKVTPIPVSESRKQYLSTKSLADLKMDDKKRGFPFDIPAIDIDHQYAIPLKLCNDNIELMINLLLKGRDCILVGADYKGKTTALHEMKDTILMNEPDILPLYIDIKKDSKEHDFDFTKTLVNALSLACGDFDSYDVLYKLAPKDALNRIVKDCEKGGKKLILFIDHLEEISWMKQMEILNDILGMPRSHGQSSSKPFAVALAGTESMWKDLTYYDPAYKTYCNKIIWNPKFQNAHIASLLKNIELYNFPIDSNALDKIKTITGGHPWYVNRLLHEIVEYTSYSSDPIELAFNRLVKNMTLNGDKTLDFDVGYVFASIFASGCQMSNEHISSICTDKLGWFSYAESPNGKILVPNCPIIRESVAYTLSKNFCSSRNDVDSVIPRLVDPKSPESLFKSWKKFVQNLCEFENSVLYFWQFMQTVADANGLQIRHEWPQGKLVLSAQLQSNIQPGKAYRVTLVDDHRNKYSKEYMLIHYIIPEAQRVSQNGLTSGTMFLPGHGNNETIEIFGIEMHLFYDDNIF